MRTTTAKFYSARQTRQLQRGFTLLELSAVIFIIAILVSLLCAALNHTKSKALRINCLDNLRQLQVAWINYTFEYDDRLPLNQTAPTPGKLMARWSSTNSWVIGSPLDDASGRGVTRGSLYPYVGSPHVYRCPMDNSKVVGHPNKLRSRSYAMNTYLGGDDIGSDPRFKARYGEITTPGKDRVFVFVEEHQSSIWASSFMVAPNNPDRLTASSSGFISTPADRHQQGANLSFADGHVEYWQWYSAMQPRATNKLASTGRELTDVRRLQSAIPQN